MMLCFSKRSAPLPFVVRDLMNKSLRVSADSYLCWSFLGEEITISV